MKIDHKIIVNYFKDLCAYVFVPVAALCWLWLVIIRSVGNIRSAFEIIHIPLVGYGVWVILKTGYDKYHRRQKK